MSTVLLLYDVDKNVYDRNSVVTHQLTIVTINRHQLNAPLGFKYGFVISKY